MGTETRWGGGGVGLFGVGVANEVLGKAVRRRESMADMLRGEFILLNATDSPILYLAPVCVFACVCVCV